MLNTSLFIQTYIFIISTLGLLKNYKSVHNYYKTYTYFNYNLLMLLISSMFILNIFSIQTTYSKLNYVLYLLLLVSFILLVCNLNMQFIVVTAISLLFLINATSSFFEIFIILELMNILLIFLILIDRPLISTYNKIKFSILITLNLIILTSGVITHIIILKTNGVSEINFIEFNSLMCKNTYQLTMLTFFILFKLGIVTGPLLNITFYNNLSSKLLVLYILFYYVLYPIVILQLVFILKINFTLLTIVLLINFILNLNNLKRFTTYRDLIFLSGQINLIYVILMFIN